MKLYKQIELEVIFCNRFTIGSLFQVKDLVPTRMLSNVVYLYKCSQCEATHCGETTCHLHTRSAKHRSVSARTNPPITNPLRSIIRDHADSCNHPIHQDSFKSIARCNAYDLKLSESILIHYRKPTLNSCDSSVALNILG
jgi:hypothetical protein